MNVLNSICRRLVFRHLAQLQDGRFELHDEQGIQVFGDQDADDTVQLEVVDDRFWKRVVFGGDLGFAESWMSGECESEDLTSLLQFFIRNAPATDRMDGGVARVRRSMSRMLHWMRRNTTANARKNIEAHYDLSNDFFGLFLDETWNYSSGVFHGVSDTMADASRNKMRLACNKLHLASDDQLLEIGTGWGALAELAANEYGCQVTSTTISQQQYDFAANRMKTAGLDQKVSLLKRDYRELQGTFDKLVSIEMIEAVGHQFFDVFFRKCASLLKPDGEFCMQAIVIADDMYDDYIRNIDFIRAYIFPGGCLPSVSALTESAARSQLQLVGLEEYGADYAETLRRWRQRFEENREEIQQLGFDDRFMRMWDYYLRYCEAGFSQHQVGLVQLVFKPRRRAVRLTKATDVAIAESSQSSMVAASHFSLPRVGARKTKSRFLGNG